MRDPSPAGVEILFRDLFPQEGISLLRAVTPKRAVARHFVHSLMKGVDACSGKPVGDVADAELDDFFVRVFLLECGNPSGDLGKQIGCLKLEIVFVDFDHGRPHVGRVVVTFHIQCRT